MFHNNLRILLLVLILHIGLGPSLKAESFIGIGVSRFFSIESENEKSLDINSGEVAYVSFPFLFGVGVEKYTFSYVNSLGQDLDLDIDMKDIFFDVPVPEFIVHLGIGIGELSKGGTLAASYEGDSVLQYFVRAGFPFGIFNLHISQHQVHTNVNTIIPSTVSDISYKITAIGVGMGF